MRIRLAFCALLLASPMLAWSAPAPAPAEKKDDKKDSKGGPGKEVTLLGEFALSLKLGLGFSSASSSVTGAANTSTNSAMGFGFGAGVDWDFWPGLLGLRSEVLYIGRKAVQSELGTEASFGYIQVPFLARYRNGIFMVLAGPYVAYNMGGVTDATGLDISDQYGSLDYGLTFGFGVLWPLEYFFTPFGELRYNWGFANISATDGTSTSWRNFDLVIGIQF